MAQAESSKGWTQLPRVRTAWAHIPHVSGDSKRLHAEASEGTHHLHMTGYVETGYRPEDMQTWSPALSLLSYRVRAYM